MGGACLENNRIVILLRPCRVIPCWWFPIAAWNRRGGIVVAIAIESRLALTELADFLVIATPGPPDSIGNLAVLDQLGIALLF
jgi:hypothetical protein